MESKGSRGNENIYILALRILGTEWRSNQSLRIEAYTGGKRYWKGLVPGPETAFIALGILAGQDLTLLSPN